MAGLGIGGRGPRRLRFSDCDDGSACMGRGLLRPVGDYGRSIHPSNIWRQIRRVVRHGADRPPPLREFRSGAVPPPAE
jgi:hypothetical protein